MKNPTPLVLGEDARVHLGWIVTPDPLNLTDGRVDPWAHVLCGIGGRYGGRAMRSRNPVTCRACIRVRSQIRARRQAELARESAQEPVPAVGPA